MSIEALHVSITRPRQRQFLQKRAVSEVASVHVGEDVIDGGDEVGKFVVGVVEMR